MTITSNSEAEGFAIPHLIDGVPVELKKINFVTTRSGFQFNPTAPWGTQANIRSVKVNLPRQLPSRLSTLQKACPISVVGCPDRKKNKKH